MMVEMSHAKEFKENGFTIARDFFKPEEIVWMIEETESVGGQSELGKGALRFYHNSYQRSERLRSLLTQRRLIDFLTPIAGPDFWIHGDQTVYKGPGAPEFPWHQDNAYSHLRVQHFQLWIALSKMDASRGGLWLVPGSHKNGLLAHRTIGNHKVYQGSTEGRTCIDAEVGDLVLFSSWMLHYTSPNVSTFDRYAYVVEFMQLDELNPFKQPPFFVVSRGGEPCSEFTNSLPAHKVSSNQFKYAGTKIGLAGKRALRKVGLKSLGDWGGDIVCKFLRW